MIKSNIKDNTYNQETKYINLINTTNDVDPPNYYDKLDTFYEQYNISKITNEKEEYRYFCFRYLNYIRSLQLCNIQLGQKYESVIVEFREFPHIEFLLRNTIHKLNEEWSHTIVCGNLNYKFVKNICDSISPNIRIIKLIYDNMSQQEYSNYLCTLNFWKLFNGAKLLIYQEDTCIFKYNINDFLEWDYIGGPWYLNQNDTPNGVGNGGFSLRTKQCMIDVINTISLENTIFNTSTLQYMSNVGLTLGPEDVYFSLNMQKYNIGKVAPHHIASNFSTECIYNKNSLGGHCFWVSDDNWKERLYENIIIQFKPFYEISILEHRGGWKSIISKLDEYDFFNINSPQLFFDMIEKMFLWETDFSTTKQWSGIIHCTHKTPDYLNCINISYLFKNPNFIKSLNTCICIITLSNYVTKYLQTKFNELKINIKIITIPHPIDIDNSIPMFDFNKFIKNNHKYIIQIGQQLRKMSSIFLLDVDSKYKKMWLTGTQNFVRCEQLLNDEINYYNIFIKDTSNVIVKYTKTFKEYDNYLSNNIVFIELFDAAANNTILECIVRQTPILVNKLEGVVDYLGKDYPLYFTNIDEIDELLTIENIFKAHIYLKKINTIDVNKFCIQIINLFY